MEKGPGSSQAAHLFLPIRSLKTGGLGAGGSVDPMTIHWPWTPDWSISSNQSPGSTWGGAGNAQNQESSQQVLHPRRGRHEAGVSSDSHPYFVNPSSLTLLIASSFPSVLLVFSKNRFSKLSP